MREEDLRQHSIRIESVQHLHGSPYGQYWGYLVVKQGELPIYFGRSKKSSAKNLCDPFPSRWRALRFAKSLAGDPEQINENEQPGEFDHMWVDHGGEG